LERPPEEYNLDDSQFVASMISDGWYAIQKRGSRKPDREESIVGPHSPQRDFWPGMTPQLPILSFVRLEVSGRRIDRIVDYSQCPWVAKLAEHILTTNVS